MAWPCRPIIGVQLGLPLSMGVAMALLLTLVLALLIGLFSLRVRAIFFAMITLAVAAAFQTLASQLSEWTGGEDGLSFKLPALLLPSTEFCDTPFWGVNLDGRLLCYYVLFVAALLQFLMLLRIVNSPFGRVLQAIRENEFRAEAIGYRVVIYRTLSSVLSALFACMAGVMLAIWLRYNGPDTSLSFENHDGCIAHCGDRGHGYHLWRSAWRCFVFVRSKLFTRFAKVGQ
jgi:branched-chain amino acid transport system permease protein